MEGDLVRGRTHYLGNVEFEFENDDLENPRIRRVIAGVAVEIIEHGDISNLHYQHLDHLGSIVALSTVNGDLLTRMHYDAWGQRKDPGGETWNQWLDPAQPAWADLMLDITPRGFTGHEHLDDHGIIHMNGRIYDPHLGRFLQADPFIEDTGTLNRYTYVHNNPLAYTDPSGFFGIKDIVKIAAVAVVSFYTAGIAKAAWAASNFGGAFVAAAMGGSVAGFISAGSVEGALWGAFSGAVFFGIGQGFSGLAEASGGVFNTGLSATEFAAQSISHGIAGGTISVMQGGRFGHGFLSAGVSKAVTPAAVSLSSNEFIQGVLVTVVGGTTSEISGGKFANGATTAAMAFAFNHMTHQEAKEHAHALNESGGEKRWAAIQLEDGTWNVMMVDDAAQRAAGLGPDTGGMASGSGQVGAAGFFLAGGVSASTGVAVDTSGNTCAFYSVCLQAGLGLGAGIGGGGALSVSEVEPGLSWPKGPFIFGGSGLFGSGSADSAGQGGSLDIIGGGFGAGAGYQWCVQNNYACSE